MTRAQIAYNCGGPVFQSSLVQKMMLRVRRIDIANPDFTMLTWVFKAFPLLTDVEYMLTIHLLLQREALKMRYLCAIS